MFYLEFILPVVFGGVSSGLVYRLYNKHKGVDDNDEFIYYDDLDSCPIIQFDKNGNYYYVYE